MTTVTRNGLSASTLQGRAPIHPLSRRLGLALALSSALLAAPSAWAQRFEVQPASARFVPGEDVSLRLSGLPAGETVRISATRLLRGFTGPQWMRAEARFRVPADGRLDLAQAEPLPGGSYQGADLRGLFWSMQPLPAEAAAALKDERWPDGEVRLQVQSAGSTGEGTGAADVRTLATQSLQLVSALPQLVQRQPAAFPGAKLYLPAEASAQRRAPVLIALGGSEGNAFILRNAALLASHGVAVLGLPYYSPPGWGPNGPTAAEFPSLPRTFTRIPVERLEAARAWLAQQPELDTERLGVFGISKGAEFALLAATRFPWLKAAIAIVPSDVVWEGWGEAIQPDSQPSFAWQGQDLPFVPYKGFGEQWALAESGQGVNLRLVHEAGRRSYPERVAAARIPVERYAGEVLVIGGGDDLVWPSAEMAENVVRSREAAGRRTEWRVYPKAGHALSGTGWSPTTNRQFGPMKLGGTAEADARAQADALVTTLAFIRRTLGTVDSPR